MSKDLVSVIIPTYNRSKMLIKAITSVQKQTYKNIEIIVVDDGSTDDTKRVVKKINDKRVKYFYKRNGGPSASRNLGLKHSKGEFITFLDDDDEYIPGKIEKQVSFLQKNPQLGFCYSNMIVVYKNQRSLLLNETKKNTYINLLLDGTGSFVTTQTIFIRRKVYTKVGFFDWKVEPAEDYDYSLRCAKMFNFGYINKPLTLYYLHDRNITGNPKYILKGISLTRLRHLITLDIESITKNLIQSYKWNYEHHLGRVLYYNGDLKTSRIYFLKSMKTNCKKLSSYIFFFQSFFKGDLLVKFFYRISMYFRFSLKSSIFFSK